MAEIADRNILSDAELDFATALHLPMFMTSGMTLLARMALVIADGTIEKVFYPVFPPDKNAAELAAFLLDAYEGDRRVFTRTWHAELPRECV